MTPLCRLCRRPPDLPEALHGLISGTAFPVGLGGEAPCPCLCWDTRHDRPESALDRYYLEVDQLTGIAIGLCSLGAVLLELQAGKEHSNSDGNFSRSANPAKVRFPLVAAALGGQTRRPCSLLAHHTLNFVSVPGRVLFMPQPSTFFCWPRLHFRKAGLAGPPRLGARPVRVLGRRAHAVQSQRAERSGLGHRAAATLEASTRPEAAREGSPPCLKRSEYCVRFTSQYGQ